MGRNGSKALSLCIEDLEIAKGNQSFGSAVPGLHFYFLVPGRVFIHMNEEADQHPESVKSVFPGIIKTQVMGMPEGRDLEEIAKGHKGGAVVGIGFVPVDAVAVGPDGF
jgi:hypothetical protein